MTDCSNIPNLPSYSQFRATETVNFTYIFLRYYVDHNLLVLFYFFLVANISRPLSKWYAIKITSIPVMV